MEQSNPDLLDLLNCAVELEDKAKQRSLTFMENRVLRQTEEKASEIVWTEGTRPPPRFWASLVFGLMLSLLFTAWSVDRSPLQKSMDSLSGEPGLFLFTTKTGSTKLEEYPASKEFSRGVFQHGFVFTKTKVFRLFCHVYLLLRLGQAEDTFAQDIALNFVSTGSNCHTE